MLDLNGKRILVTGASSGLGKSFANMLTQQGAKVAIAARRERALEILAAETGAIPVKIDVTNNRSVCDGISKTIDSLGGLDGVVNNAGVAASSRAVDTSMDEWRYVMDANLDGVFRVAQASATQMQTNGGSIVNISSILGLRVQSGVAAYATSKAAVAHLTKSLALEWAKYNIRVNALAPGYFPTEINDAYLKSDLGIEMSKSIPMRRFGSLQELHAPLALLLSDASSYMTGCIIPVDGGHLNSAL